MRKYQTEEERKEAKRQYMKQYYQDNKEKRIEYDKQRYQVNKEKIAEQHKQYYQANKEKRLEQIKQYQQDNREHIVEQKKQRYQTPMGRATNMVRNHKQKDKKANRGECTLTAQWIIDNIFSSKCIYCGESDWRKLGCDRIDNSLPHTPSNVVCCCGDCNIKRGTKSFEEFLAECKKDL